MTTEAHIHILRQENVPARPVEDFCDELAPDLIVEAVERPEPGPFAALEWLIPTAVIAYLAKPYFTAFLGEAGKDHYHMLKAAVSKLGRAYTLQSPAAQRYVASKGKVESEVPDYFLTFSVLAYVHQNLNFKLLIRSGAGDEELEKSISSFLYTVLRIHSGEYQEGEIRGIHGAKPYSDTIILGFDADSEQLFVLDPLKRRKQI